MGSEEGEEEVEFRVVIRTDVVEELLASLLVSRGELLQAECGGLRLLPAADGREVFVVSQQLDKWVESNIGATFLEDQRYFQLSQQHVVHLEEPFAVEEGHQ